MAREKQLALFSETECEDKSLKDYPVSCPTLDLSATWDSIGKTLLILRPPGQTVSKIHQVAAPGQKAPEAQTATWKPDGQFLAVGWSDGFVRLMGLENNKAAHHIRVCESPGVRITHIGWASNSIVEKSINLTSQATKRTLFIEEDLHGDEVTIDLPRELALLEVDTALPKISPLPSGSAGSGEDAMVFTLRTGIEFLFQPSKPEDYDHIDVMVVGTSDGKLQLIIYDSFVIGNFSCSATGLSGGSQLLHHASHPEIPTHALLLAESAEEPPAVHLVPMDLPFVSSSPINLSLLASKLTTLQKLLRYLKQAQLHMEVEWKNTCELPNRFLRSVQEDLEQAESGPRNIISALYHTVVTGHAHKVVHEWLVDSLAERGHKRWDKAVSSGLENLRSLVHENFLPALDRCAVILSRLKGLAQFYDSRDDIGFTATQINRLMDIISCLKLVGNKILVSVMDELEYFTSFSMWMRFQIDRLASSSGGEELTEKEASIDHSKVLIYIETYLTESPLRIYFDEINSTDYDADWEHIEDGPSLLDVLDKQLKRFENGQPSMKALPHVNFLVNYMTTWANRVFKSIAEAKKRSVRFGDPIKLSIGHPITSKDVRMCKVANNDMKMMTALTSKETKNQVFIFSADIDIMNGISSNLPPTSCKIDLGPRTLIDFKFLNDKLFVILCVEANNVLKIICVPIQPGKLSHSPYDPGNPDEIIRVSADNFATYSFPDIPALNPVRIEVHDSSNVRGEVPARVCLLESNLTTLRVFVLPDSAV